MFRASRGLASVPNLEAPGNKRDSEGHMALIANVSRSDKRYWELCAASPYSLYSVNATLRACSVLHPWFS